MERIIEQKLRHQTNISDNQFGFMRERKINNGSYIHSQEADREVYREERRTTYSTYSSKKSYHRILREIIWHILGKNNIYKRYVHVIIMYDGVVAGV